MQLDSEADKQMLLQVMKQATIPGAIATQYALLMNRVALAPVATAPEVKDEAPAGEEPSRGPARPRARGS